MESFLTALSSLEPRDISGKLTQASAQSIRILSSSTNEKLVKRELAATTCLVASHDAATNDFIRTNFGLSVGEANGTQYNDRAAIARETFATQCYQEMLVALLTKFLPSWYFKLSADEVKYLIDPLIDQGPSLFCFIALCQSLSPGTKAASSEGVERVETSFALLDDTERQTQVEAVEEQRVMVVARRLGRFFGIDGAKSATQQWTRLLGSLATLPSTQRAQFFPECLQFVSSLCNRVSNVLKRRSPSYFSPSVFFAAVSSLSCDFMETLHFIPDGTMIPLDPRALVKSLGEFPILGQLLGKLSSLGYSSLIADRLVSMVTADSSTNYTLRVSLVKSTLTAVPTNALEPLWADILHSLASKQDGERVLELLIPTDELSSFPTLKFLLTSKFIVSKPFEYQVLHHLLSYLLKVMGPDKLYADVVTPAANVWADSNFIRKSSDELHKYVSSGIIMALKLVSDKNTFEASGLLMRLINGVQYHMESAVPTIRKMGMMVAEVFSSILDPENMLKFDYEIDPTDNLIRGDFPKTIFSEAATKHASQEVLREPLTMKMDEKQDAPPAQKKRLIEEIDDDLEPIGSLDEEPPKDKLAKIPLYLRECITALRSEDPDTIEGALSVVGVLIRSKPDDLEELAVPLAGVILHLTNEHSATNFASLRRGALVALAVNVPIPIADYLTAQFRSKNYSLQQRLDILDTLADAAVELSAIETFANAQAKQKSNPSIMLVEDDAPTDSSKAVSKTRRWGSAIQRGQKNPAAPVRNSFAHVAGHFFWDLLHEWNGSPASSGFAGMDSILLGKLIFVLGTIVECAGEANPRITDMIREILAFMWTFRFHPSSFVRRAVLLSSNATLRAVPPAILTDSSELTSDLNELFIWSSAIAQNDEDEECRNLANIAMVRFSQLREKTVG